MTTLATETWTAANGSAWPAQWVTGQTAAGGTVDVQSNRGRLASGTQGGYSGASRVSRRLNITPPVDVEISGSWTPDTAEPYGLVVVRADNTIDTQTGYHLTLDKSGTLSLTRRIAYTSTLLASFPFAAASSTTYGFRLRAVGSSIQARVWSGSEPTTWQVDVTDTGITGSGAVGLSVAGGAAATQHSIAFDDVVVTNGASGAQAALTATHTLTASATLSAHPDAAHTLTAGFSGSAGLAHTADATFDLTHVLAPGSDISVIPRRFTRLRVYAIWDGRTLTDITDRVIGTTTIRHGRATELGDVGPSVMATTLDNSDGYLTPDNPDSPWWPNVRLERQVYVYLERGEQQWPIFNGWLKVMLPDFPSAAASSSTVQIQAVDALGLAAARTLNSQWVHAAALWANVRGTRYDAIVVAGDGSATDYLDNVTTSPGPKARAVIQAPPGGIEIGPLSFGPADGLSIEGAATFAPAEDGVGSVIKMTLPTPARSLQWWIRIPTETQVDATTPRRDILRLTTAADALVGTVELTNNAGQTDLNLYSAAGAFLGTLAFGCNTGAWVRVTALTRSADPTQSEWYYDGGGRAGGGYLPTVPIDLRAVGIARFGGAGTAVAKHSVAGILAFGLESAAVPAADGQIAGGTGTVAQRLTAWAWVSPLGRASTIGTESATQARTGTWHGRTALAVGQEIARTGRGVLWVDPPTGRPRFWAADVCYPATPLITIDPERDLIGTPRLTDAVDGSPTRITVEYPRGRATVIDAGLEAASAVVGPGSEQVRPATVSTVCADRETAEAIGADLLERANRGMRISSLTLDLNSSGQDHIPVLFDAATPGAGLRPTQRLRVLVPRSHFGVDHKDVFVEGWTLTLDPATDGAALTLDLSPAARPPGAVTADATFALTSTTLAAVAGASTGTGTGATPNSVRIGTQTRALAGINPTSTAYPGGRGVDELVVYRAPLTATVTNQWGTEVTVGADGRVIAVYDRQITGSLTGTTIPAGGFVLSGHGTARDWLNTYAVVGALVELVATGTTGGGTTPGASGYRSGMPWAFGVFGHTASKVAAFEAMAGTVMDFVDMHPGWDSLVPGLGGGWWYLPLVGQPYTLHVSCPMYGPDGVGVDHSAYFANAAAAVYAAGFRGVYWRLGTELNLPNEWQCTDANQSQWITRFRQNAAAIRAATPDTTAQVLINVNEGNSQSCSNATTLAVVEALAGDYDILSVDYYDQYPPIFNDTQRDARFGTASGPFGSINYWLGVARRLGRKFALPEWGVSSGTQWAGNAGGDNPYYVNAVMDWAGANADTVVLMSYFEEDMPYLRSDITTTAINPNARTAFQQNVTQWKGTTAPPPPPPTGGGGSGVNGPLPANVVAVYKMMWSVNGPNLGAVPSTFNVINLAFGQGTPPSLVGWGSQGQASFLADLAAKVAAGVRIHLSLGGAGGAIDISNRAAIKSGLTNIRNALGGNLHGIDWDLEGSANLGSADCVDISSWCKSTFGANFAITFAPNGSNQAQYRTAAAACQAAGCLDMIGQQYYDAVVSLSAAIGNINAYLAAGIPQSKMSVGMMIGSSSIYWTNQQARDNMAAIRAQFPQITKAYLWEATRSGTAQWATDMRAVIGF